MRATTKAMIKLLGWAHREAGRFFIVKGAQATEICPALFELHVPTHHVDNINAIEQVLNKALRDHDKLIRAWIRP